MSLQEIRIFITVNPQKYAQIFAKKLEYLHFFYGFSFRKLWAVYSKLLYFQSNESRSFFRVELFQKLAELWHTEDWTQLLRLSELRLSWGEVLGEYLGGVLYHCSPWRIWSICH